MYTLCIHNNNNSMGPQTSAFNKNSQNVLATAQQHLANQTQHQQNGGHFFARSSTSQIYFIKCTCLVVIIIIFFKMHVYKQLQAVFMLQHPGNALSSGFAWLSTEPFFIFVLVF